LEDLQGIAAVEEAAAAAFANVSPSSDRIKETAVAAQA